MDNSNATTTSETATPLVEATPDVSQEKLIPVTMTPTLNLLLLFLAILVSLILITFLIFPSAPKPTVLTPSPFGRPDSSSLPQQIRPLSALGQTAEFKAFESHLNALTTSQEALDLNQSQLIFPLLEMNVNYN
jgi:hypothetical protein